MSRTFGTGLALAGPLVLAAAVLGGRFTAMGIGPWYDGLAKPSWTPPGSVIGAVWTVLYVLIALASALVWSRAAEPPRAYAAALLVNLVLNAAWCWLFFGLRRPDLGLAEIAVLWITCVALVLLAARASAAAVAMLIPYAAWVAFAGFLNARIVALNR
ncbi:MAG TPA: TspO/MBR family protein [Thermoanaerobaculia bacterium]|nr:TspO/MBR family protein [Thermoanaerobaculia bacterium]